MMGLDIFKAFAELLSVLLLLCIFWLRLGSRGTPLIIQILIKLVEGLHMFAHGSLPLLVHKVVPFSLKVLLRPGDVRLRLALAINNLSWVTTHVCVELVKDGAHACLLVLEDCFDFRLCEVELCAVEQAKAFEDFAPFGSGLGAIFHVYFGPDIRDPVFKKLY